MSSGREGNNCKSSSQSMGDELLKVRTISFPCWNGRVALQIHCTCFAIAATYTTSHEFTEHSRIITFDGVGIELATLPSDSLEVTGARQIGAAVQDRQHRLRLT